MAAVQFPVRRMLKPLLLRLLGHRGYFHMQKEMALLPRLVHEGGAQP